jgi:hypothetical protein
MGLVRSAVSNEDAPDMVCNLLINEAIGSPDR